MRSGQQAPLAPAGPVGGTAPLWPPPAVAAAAVPRWLPLLLRSYPLLNKLCIPVSETAKLRLTSACVFAEAVLCVCICKGINLLFHNVSCGGLFRCVALPQSDIIIVVRGAAANHAPSALSYHFTGWAV